ncbi:ATP-binding protein [Streptomyces sp. NPDC004330]|uniref:ATP-binding protein n=1 Tax=Streptomyces sp. NPDC004330 TaxID=3364700 RepID=UPI00369F7D2D
MKSATASSECRATAHVPLAADAQAARQARRTAARLLALEAGLCPREVAEDLELIVSELVTNAVLHAAGPYALTFSLERGRAGVAVSDGSTDLSGRQGSMRQIGPGGRGLKIIRGLGADLFVSPSERGKQVIAVLTW